MGSADNPEKSDGFEKERGQWLDQVAADADLPAAGLRAAIMVSHYMNRDERRAWPSMDRIAQDYGLRRQTVLAGLTALVERGHLDVTPGRGRRSSQYRWHLSGIEIRSEQARWTSRSGPEASTTTDDDSGPEPRTTSDADEPLQAPRSGAHIPFVVVRDSDRSGPESRTQTFEEPSIEPSIAGGLSEPGRPFSDAETYDEDEPLHEELYDHPEASNDEPYVPGARVVLRPPAAGKNQPLLISGYAPADFRELFAEIWSLRPWTDDEDRARLEYARSLHHRDPSALVAELRRPTREIPDKLFDFLRHDMAVAA